MNVWIDLVIVVLSGAGALASIGALLAGAVG
jgi:hypothetical protein